MTWQRKNILMDMLILIIVISQKLHKTKLKNTLCTIKEGTWDWERSPGLLNTILSYHIQLTMSLKTLHLKYRTKEKNWKIRKMESINKQPEDAYQDIWLLCQHTVSVLVIFLYCSYHNKIFLMVQPQEEETILSLPVMWWAYYYNTVNSNFYILLNW